jgi:F-box/leucine-rich repeat protein 10/11
LQYQSWLGDMVDEVFKVELKEGNTMVIPSGWIHAVVSVCLFSERVDTDSIIVYTCGYDGFRRQFPSFLQCPDPCVIFIVIICPGFTVSMTELRVRNIEIATSVPKKFRFPSFPKYVCHSKLHWRL